MSSFSLFTVAGTSSPLKPKTCLCWRNWLWCVYSILRVYV